MMVDEEVNDENDRWWQDLVAAKQGCVGRRRLKFGGEADWLRDFEGQRQASEGNRLWGCAGTSLGDSCSPALRCSKRSLQHLAPSSPGPSRERGAWVGLTFSSQTLLSNKSRIQILAGSSTTCRCCSIEPLSFLTINMRQRRLWNLKKRTSGRAGLCAGGPHRRLDLGSGYRGPPLRLRDVYRKTPRVQLPPFSKMPDKHPSTIPHTSYGSCGTAPS